MRDKGSGLWSPDFINDRYTSNNQRLGSTFVVTRLSVLCQVGDDVICPCKICGGCQIRNQRCPIEFRLQSVSGVRSFYVERNYHYLVSAQGFWKSQAYIATQYPLEDTTDDFWRMVWQEKCRSLVMLVSKTELEQVRDVLPGVG